LEKKFEESCKEVESLKKELKSVKNQCEETLKHKIQIQLALKENARLSKENEDYSNQIIKLNEKLEGMKNVSIQHVVEKKVLKDNAQTLSNALLKTQNNIEIFKRDFQHFSKLIKNKMEFY
jgi:predicted transcriptional regulator